MASKKNYYYINQNKDIEQGILDSLKEKSKRGPRGFRGLQGIMGRRNKRR